MRQNYLKILIGIICVLWIIYFIQNVTFYKNEGFIKMKDLYLWVLQFIGNLLEI